MSLLAYCRQAKLFSLPLSPSVEVWSIGNRLTSDLLRCYLVPKSTLGPARLHDSYFQQTHLSKPFSYLLGHRPGVLPFLPRFSDFNFISVKVTGALEQWNNMSQHGWWELIELYAEVKSQRIHLSSKYVYDPIIWWILKLGQLYKA